MVKDAPNQIFQNMIGSAQTSRKILKDGEISIFPVILITLTCMVLMTGPKLGSHYPPSARRLIQYVYDRIFSAIVRHTPPCLEVYEHHRGIICRFLQPILR